MDRYRRPINGYWAYFKVFKDDLELELKNIWIIELAPATFLLNFKEELTSTHVRFDDLFPIFRC